MWVNILVAWLAHAVGSQLPGRSAHPARLSHWKASFDRQRCGSSCYVNADLLIPSPMYEAIRGCCLVFRGKKTQEFATVSICSGFKKQSRKTQLTWHLPISSPLCPHKFYLEIHNSHASCPLWMVSGKCSSPQISTPDISFLCEPCPHSGRSELGMPPACAAQEDVGVEGSTVGAGKERCGAGRWSQGHLIVLDSPFCCSISRPRWKGEESREADVRAVSPTSGQEPPSEAGGVND